MLLGHLYIMDKVWTVCCVKNVIGLILGRINIQKAFHYNSFYVLEELNKLGDSVSSLFDESLKVSSLALKNFLLRICLDMNLF